MFLKAQIHLKKFSYLLKKKPWDLKFLHLWAFFYSHRKNVKFVEAKSQIIRKRLQKYTYTFKIIIKKIYIFKGICINILIHAYKNILHAESKYPYTLSEIYMCKAVRLKHFCIKCKKFVHIFVKYLHVVKKTWVNVRL